MGIIENDFKEFVDNEDLFNSDVKIYVSKSGSLVFDGKGIYDKKPQLVENENNDVFYQGHKSILSISMNGLDMDISDFKNYYVEIISNGNTLEYTIANPSYSSNVNKAYFELKEFN